MKTPSVIFNGQSITTCFDGRPYALAKGQSKFEEAIEAWRAKDWGAFEACFDVRAAVARYTNGAVSITNNFVYVNGKKVTALLTNRIMEAFKSRLPYGYLVAFLNNCAENPSPVAIEELYNFLESGKITITDDGCFLAYRVVDENYLSFHENPDGTRNLNTIGKTVSMDRKLVNENRNQTCSTGLHFCSFDYVPQYQNMHKSKSFHVMVVKINPKDVVSIPMDYANTKGRCCFYEVVDEVDGYSDALSTSEVYTVDTKVEDGVKKATGIRPIKRDALGRFCSGDSSLPKRDALGRFVAQ
jgi:hypothetical protein